MEVSIVQLYSNMELMLQQHASSVVAGESRIKRGDPLNWSDRAMIGWGWLAKLIIGVSVVWLVGPGSSARGQGECGDCRFLEAS